MSEDPDNTAFFRPGIDLVDTFLWLLGIVVGAFLGNRIAYSLRHYSGRQILPGIELPNTILTPEVVEDWLDNHHFDDYEREVREDGYFEFRIQTDDSEEMVVQLFQQGLRIYGEYELPADRILMIMERPADRRRLKTEIEAVLTNAPGAFDYFDDDGNSCNFEEMRGVRFEYRLYPDGLSQHELNNGLLSIDQALHYVEKRVDQMADNLQESS
jgi:hypothetical protein